MAYEQRTQRRQRARYNSLNADNKLKYQLIVDGAKVTPLSGLITIYKPGSTTAVLTAQAMSVTGTVLYYSLDTTDTNDFPAATGYRADLTITRGDQTYQKHFMFDVVKYLFDMNIGYDQLVAMDDSIRAMEHNGDEDFSELIESCIDNLHLKIENKIIQDQKLLSNAILDVSGISTCAKYYILWKIHFEKRDYEAANVYRDEFNSLWESTLNTIKYDEDGDGQENAEIGGIQEVRLVT